VTQTLSSFEPIERESVAEKVAQRILTLIKTGSLKPGDQLPPERELAVAMQVSRPSVREALRGLSILGVVRIRQGGGAFISSLDASAMLEPLSLYMELDAVNVDALYDARIMIETGIARRAAERIGDDQIARLRALLGPQRALVADPVGFRVSDQEFHTIIWTGAANPFLHRVAAGLNVLGMEYRRTASETPGVLEQSYRDHIAIVEALERRDAEAVAEAMRLHMQNVHRTTLAAMRKTKEESAG
jgi:DNA-binding FadR family transcriptional regulator